MGLDIHDAERDKRQRKNSIVMMTLPEILQEVVAGKPKRLLLLKIQHSCLKLLKLKNR